MSQEVIGSVAEAALCTKIYDAALRLCTKDLLTLRCGFARKIF
jgi:hypothetical protein